MARVSGSGSVVQLDKSKPKNRCRSWQLRVSVGKDPATGKYRVRTRRFHGTWSDATSALRCFVREIEEEGSGPRPRTSYTLRQYVDRYMEARKSLREVEPTTLRNQEYQLGVVCDHLGAVRLGDVTTAMISDMYVDMLNGKTRSGRPVKGTYIRAIHSHLSPVFRRAVEEGLIPSNPCKGVVMPKDDRSQKKAMTREQAHDFVEALDPTDPRECAYLLAVTMGLRRGEICGLSWGDVDFDDMTVNVHHSYDMFGNLKTTKTRAGVRILPLPEKTAEGLKAQKEAQLRRFARTNAARGEGEGHVAQDDSTAVITDWFGARVSPRSLGSWWDVDRKHFGLGDFTLHELRHTYLTLLAETGVHPNVMQQLAGHTKSQITMDIYTHVHMDAKREAVEAVSKIF